ncbi:MAG: glycosyltransferase, partial [Christensenellales bacterium]|nr:glycosyltransferase [Christensenellales bacterium]
MVPEKKDRIEISVIVPIYRVEVFLPACIDSILKQTFRNIEVILVDDGSDDGCPAICDAAAEKDARVQVIHQKNQGLSAARNTGIDAAKGEYIAFVDSDDTIEPTMLESMLERIRQDGSEMALCNYRYV